MARKWRQKSRRKIIDKYEYKFSSEDYAERFNQLKNKVHKRAFIPKMICIWGLILYLPSWLISFIVGFPTLGFLEKESHNFVEWMMMLTTFVTCIWDLAGPFVFLLMFIITLIARKRDSYYLNIKNI